MRLTIIVQAPSIMSATIHDINNNLRLTHSRFSYLFIQLNYLNSITNVSAPEVVMKYENISEDIKIGMIFWDTGILG